MLIEAASRLFGSVNVNCNAILNTTKQVVSKSKIPFPMPLNCPRGSRRDYSYRNAQFSRRDNDDIQYRISVSYSEDATSLVHSISFESTLELGLNSVRGLLHMARSISTRLVREGGN